MGLPDPQVPLFGHYGALTPAQLGVRRCVRRFLLDPFGIWLSYWKRIRELFRSIQSVWEDNWWDFPWFSSGIDMTMGRIPSRNHVFCWELHHRKWGLRWLKHSETGILRQYKTMSIISAVVRWDRSHFRLSFRVRLTTTHWNSYSEMIYDLSHVLFSVLRTWCGYDMMIWWRFSHQPCWAPTIGHRGWPWNWQSEMENPMENPRKPGKRRFNDLESRNDEICSIFPGDSKQHTLGLGDPRSFFRTL